LKVETDQRKRVLVVDSEEVSCGIVRSYVESLGFLCTEVSSAGEALKQLGQTEFSIVISGLILPELDGLELVDIIKRKHPNVDVLIISASERCQSPVGIIEAGASDFMTTPFSMEQLRARLHKIEREKEVRSELYVKGITDELTGLFNRRYFHQTLEREMRRSSRQVHPLSIMMFDVDGFKGFNDRHGHPKGDRILQVAARVIRCSIRDNVDLAFRYGGDEFTAIFPEVDEHTAASIGNRIKQKFKDVAPAGLTLSMGAAEFHKDCDFEAFVDLADERMYADKSISKKCREPSPVHAVRKNTESIQSETCDNPLSSASSAYEGCLSDPAEQTHSERGHEMEGRFSSLGEMVRVAFTLGNGMVRIGGVVVYTESLSDGNTLVGLEFVEVSDKDCRLLDRFLGPTPLKC
jgi:diguanylate cyclase (GGDEF)-like protein